MSTIPSREEALFADALAQPAAHRVAFLAQACGADASLLGRLIALVAAHEGPESLLAHAPVPSLAVAAEEKPGDAIGHYKLLQKLGEGGCGVVWMAEQEAPVRRRVALKVIKLGMDTKAVVARFEAERQALAMMDHPNIAKVHDAGATDTGRPFFVMELVRGIPITKYCDENHLTPKDRLELFIKVCQAVQHAHQKGIIHRDLKPSNVLVTLHDDEPVPVLIDFGIAKATQGRLINQTLFTAFDQFIGTPVYMAPEQADYNALDVDTRSDIYSLGVLLYELLTGYPPFDPKTLASASIEQIRRVIRESEPPRPSTRFRSLGAEEQTTVARLRRAAPPQLSSLLQGDLDWIVMKALEKSRARRYETATALAADITHYLNHEPVAARPPSTAYWIGKLIRRHRLAFAAAAAMTATLVAATIVSTWQMVRARQAETVAELERRNASDQRTQADELLGFMLGEFRSELQKVGRLDLLEKVGDRAMTYFTSLEPRNLNDTALARHATNLRQIGEVRMQQAREDEALDSFRTAYSRVAELALRHPKNGNLLFERGQAEFWIGNLHRRRGELRPAREWLTKYRDTGLALVALDPRHPSWRSELAHGHQVLAVANFDAGNLDGARRGFLDELNALMPLLNERPNDLNLKARVSEIDSWLGSVAECQGTLAEAVDRFARHCAQIERIVLAEPGNAVWRGRLADARSLHSTVLAITGPRSAAVQQRAQALALLDSLIAVDPKNRALLHKSLDSRVRHARLLRAESDGAAAAELVAAACEKLEQMAVAEPSDLTLAGRLAAAYRFRAEMRLGANDVRAARADVARAIEIGESLTADRRRKRQWIGDFAQAHIVAGMISEALGDGAGAATHWRKSIEVLQPYLAHTRDWILIDPAARAFALLGQINESRTLIDRLTRFGYDPLEPWPRGATDPLVRNNINPE